jgi:hypothetical protein
VIHALGVWSFLSSNFVSACEVESKLLMEEIYVWIWTQNDAWIFFQMFWMLISEQIGINILLQAQAM